MNLVRKCVQKVCGVTLLLAGGGRNQNGVFFFFYYFIPNDLKPFGLFGWYNGLMSHQYSLSANNMFGSSGAYSHRAKSKT